MTKIYDLIIIGAGPAGATAAIYAKRGMLDILVIDAGIIGGALNATLEVENYPSFPLTTGPELSQKLSEHMESLQIPVVELVEITDIDLVSEIKNIKTYSHGEYRAKAIIICTGASPNKLNIPGEQEYNGKGVSYCAVCDGFFFRDKEIVVFGGGDSALEEGIYLTKYGKRVRIVHRRDQLRGQKILQDRAFKNSKIEFIWNSVPDEVIGDGNKVTGVWIKDVKTGERILLETDGIFPYVGIKPAVDFLKEQVKLSNLRYVITDQYLQTNLEGVFCAGDVRDTVLRQIIVACGEGAIAATSAIKYIEHFNEAKAIVS